MNTDKSTDKSTEYQADYSDLSPHYIVREATKAFYKEIESMLWSINRREEFISEYTPVCEVNWGGVFCLLPKDIEVHHLESLLEDHKRLHKGGTQ